MPSQLNDQPFGIPLSLRQEFRLRDCIERRHCHCGEYSMYKNLKSAVIWAEVAVRARRVGYDRHKTHLSQCLNCICEQPRIHKDCAQQIPGFVSRTSAPWRNSQPPPKVPQFPLPANQLVASPEICLRRTFECLVATWEPSLLSYDLKWRQ
jgi:hypothetical protein